MKTLVVQKKLPYWPATLDQHSGPFLQEVQQLVREARAQHRDLDLELADIGFVPRPEYIEIKLYFREPDNKSEPAIP